MVLALTLVAGCFMIPEGHPADTFADKDVALPPDDGDRGESCNGIDDNGNGLIDEGVAQWGWADEDGDGYGDPDTLITYCPGETPSISDDPRDCDDSDPEVKPTGLFWLEDVSAAAGASLVHRYALPDADDCPFDQAGGAAAADFDGDGSTDLFVPRIGVADVLLLNRGGEFEEHSADVGLLPGDSSTAALAFDANGDEHVDLYVTSMGDDPARLYINNGSAYFVEMGLVRGVDLTLPDGATPRCANHFGASAGDVDGDGDLDLHVTSWWAVDDEPRAGSHLFANDGNGFFTDVTGPAGVGLDDPARTSVLHDLDDDGDLDLFVAADRSHNSLFENLGDGTFAHRGVALSGLDTAMSARGVAVGDLDHDGTVDLVISGANASPADCDGTVPCTDTHVFIGAGDLTWIDRTVTSGLEDPLWGWGVLAADLDLDGWLDLYQETGAPAGHPEDMESRVWLSGRDGTFADAQCSAGWFWSWNGRSATPLDYDEDGDLDLFTTPGDGAATQLWRNRMPSRPWLMVEVRQTGPNPLGIGSKVVVESSSLTQTRWIHASSTWLGNGPAEAFFGIPAGDVLRSVEVTFPDGETRTWTGLPTHERFVATRP